MTLEDIKMIIDGAATAARSQFPNSAADCAITFASLLAAGLQEADKDLAAKVMVVALNLPTARVQG